MEDFLELAHSPQRQMHGAVSTLTGDLQTGCYFDSITDAWSRQYINWGFACGWLIRLTGDLHSV